LKFKCASRRTCNAWVEGGPVTDKDWYASTGVCCWKMESLIQTLHQLC
jgi:hypothetical protein